MKRITSYLGFFAATLLAGGVGGACGSSELSTFDGGLDSGLGDSGAFDPSDPPAFGDSGPADAAAMALRVEPPAATVSVTGSLAAPQGSITLKAYVTGTSEPVAAKWSLDDASLGTITQDGVFTAGALAGTTKARAQVGNLIGTADLTVQVKLEEDLSSGLSAQDKAALRGRANADPGFKWLYPYDKTVFPRGLPAPRMQFSGSKPRGFRVHLKSKAFEYEGFYPGSGNAARVAVSEAWWKAVTGSAASSDPVTVEVTKIEGSANVTGPRAETWHVAQGSLKGTVFYNSYNSRLASAAGFEGAILRVKPGTAAQVFIGQVALGDGDKCVVCHSVAAGGGTLVTAVGWSGSQDAIWGATMNISATGTATKRRHDDESRKMAFGALSADSKWLVSNGVPAGGQQLRGLADGPYASRLYDNDTGAVVNDAFFGPGNQFAVTPAFSPDGKHLAYSDRKASDGHTLAVVDFNAAASPPTFTAARVLTTVNDKVVGWPSFLPDSRGVVYHVGDAYDTAGHTDRPMLTDRRANLFWVDLATRKAHALDALNGRDATGKSYLPYADGEDLDLNYEPTVLPTPVGGFFWAVFTSRRSFGNTIYDGPSSIHAAGDKPFENPQEGGRGYRKKLWVAAIDINAPADTDPSHPAFYLEGQEAEAGNMRGFWALDACRNDGSTCESGDECCGGFCRQVPTADGGSAKQCVPPPASCSQLAERCVIAADCCTAAQGTKCINSVCAVATPK